MKRRRRCPACGHVEREAIDGALSAGVSPRSLVRRYEGLYRKAARRYRDGCLAGPGGGVIPNG